MALSAVFTLLLHRLTAQDDLVLGMPVLGRSQPADMHVVGYCTHLLPLRSRLGAASFADHLDATRATMLSAFDHQALPFAELLTVAREKNSRLGITGMLLYKAGLFLQVLEGDSVRVRELYSKIASDERHRAMLGGPRGHPPGTSLQ